MPRTRRARRSSGLPILSRLFYPVGAIISATGKSARNVSRSVGNIAGKTVNTVGKVGSRFAKAGNNSIRKLTARKSRKSRKANKRH
jgi:hypothetical protein